MNEDTHRRLVTYAQAAKACIAAADAIEAAYAVEAAAEVALEAAADALMDTMATGIDAIKLLHSRTGLGLAEARATVDASPAHAEWVAAHPEPSPPPSPEMELRRVVYGPAMRRVYAPDALLMDAADKIVRLRSDLIASHARENALLAAAAEVAVDVEPAFATILQAASWIGRREIEVSDAATVAQLAARRRAERAKSVVAAVDTLRGALRTLSAQTLTKITPENE